MLIKKFITIPLLLLLLSFHTADPDTPRLRIPLDFDWSFQLGDVEGAENEVFDDASWRTLDLPHDWSIEGNYDQANPSGIAGAFLPAGIGWYRKTIDLEELPGDDQYFIEFDGVYMNSDVWINGVHLGNRPYGYISFSYNLTPFLKAGKNVLAVRVDHSNVPSGRWYTGSGIYRHVWLTRTKNVYIPQWGTRVVSQLEDKNKAELSLEIQLSNKSGSSQHVSVESFLLDPDGKRISRDKSKINMGEEGQLTHRFRVKDPALWSPDDPNMYTIETEVKINGQELDFYQTTTGIRTAELRGSEGFFLNGESIKFKGLCNHHDAGPVGSAVPDDVLLRRLKLLKEMGCNALRTTHNPYSPEFYTMCDTMGFLVMNEAFDGWWDAKADYDYGIYFEEWWQTDLADFIRRDRNHPSVVIWSIGNEVHGFSAAQQKEIVDFVRQLDDSRPVTQGSGYGALHIDIAGFNGDGEYKESLEEYHRDHPDRAIIGTEITHTLQTRGIYRTKTWYRTKDNPAPWEKPADFDRMEARVVKIPDLSVEEVFEGVNPKYHSSYDNSIVRIGARDSWKQVEKHDYYLGNFRWTGFDYLGESFGWPARTANFGIIDLAGFPKDHYYLYQSLWSKTPMVHMLPHWTHPGKEGVKIPVVVYTNCQSAELFLNNRSLGEQQIGEEEQLVWSVPYEAGEIKVVARNGGEEICKKSYTTAGEATGIDLIADRKSIRNNRGDVVYIEAELRDENGIMLPDANHMIEFEIRGPAKLLGVENGDILDLAPHKVNYRKAFNGKCLLIIQSTGEKGMIEVEARSDNLMSGSVRIVSGN
jgi:beta-galactosidase